MIILLFFSDYLTKRATIKVFFSFVLRIFLSSYFSSCLHEWQPHDGEPITALFFCDNHLAQEENVSFWRFLITGAKYNSEIKVWCSVSWKCLQTLR